MTDLLDPQAIGIIFIGVFILGYLWAEKVTRRSEYHPRNRIVRAQRRRER